MKTFHIGDLLRLRKNQRFAYIYDETGFVADNRKAMFHEDDPQTLMFLGFDHMKNTTVCKVLLGSSNRIGYIRYDQLEPL